jgi:hypothetical protein
MMIITCPEGLKCYVGVYVYAYKSMCLYNNNIHNTDNFKSLIRFFAAFRGPQKSAENAAANLLQ